MPRSNGVAVRLARCAGAYLPAALAVAVIMLSPRAQAITAVLPKNTLIAEVGRPFTTAFIPVNSHLPKYPVVWSLSPAKCLDGSGISLDANTGTLSGTPGEPGTFNCVIVAVDTFPDPLTTAQRAFTLIVDPGRVCVPPIITSTPPAATVGVFYSFVVTASGDPPPELSVTGLPSGLAFDGTTNVISGVPGEAGTATLTVTAANACAAPVVQPVLLAVERAITTLSLAVQPEVAIFGQPVTATVIASGGPPTPQGEILLCVRGTGVFCGPPFDTVPPGTATDKVAPLLTGALDPNGSAHFRLPGLTIDAFVLSAYYAGDESHLPSISGAVDELVIKGVLLPQPPDGKSAIAASSSQASAIPALSSFGMALLSLVIAALAMLALRRRTRR